MENISSKAYDKLFGLLFNNKYISNNDLIKLVDDICLDYICAYHAAAGFKCILEDINLLKKCEDAVCNSNKLFYIYLFAKNITNSDIIKCQKAIAQDPIMSFKFFNDIPGANIDIAKEAVKGTRLQKELAKILMEKACG